jgi:predicted phosphoribosyltransferase
VVAREIAAALDAELDIIVARKVGLPWKPEYKVGAVSAGGPVVFDHAALAGAGTAVSAMAGSVRGHRVKLHDRQIRYRGERPTPPIAARTVVIADDGMTPGVVARAAAQAVQAGGPARLIYAAPVCAAEHADLISADVDAVVHLYSPRVFHALGLWYRDFSPVTDDDVAAVLAITWGANSPAWGTKSAAPVG